MQLSINRSGADLAKISRELRQVGNGREIRKQFAKEVRVAARPIVPAVRAAIRAIPTQSGRHTGLRKRLASATRLKVKLSGRDASVVVLVDPAKMPSGQKSLPMAMEGTKRWRHPVFGDTDVWVTQKPHPFFYRTVIPMSRRSKAGVARAINNVTKKIT